MSPSSISSNNHEAIILAGGLGTRLREAVPEWPKCLAPVAGKPFLSYVIDSLRMQGIQHLIFSLGYKAEMIEAFLKEAYPTLSYNVVIEQEPLGTGGAVLLALHKAKTSRVLIANGDTLFKINAAQLFDASVEHDAECVLALKPMQHFDRYGLVMLDEDGWIQSFHEKAYHEKGLINGGVYILDKEKFFQRNLSKRFSFEKDYLERFCAERIFFGRQQPGYFIDIGVPADYEQAQKDLVQRPFNLNEVDKTWTLFLDRDGVINEERQGEYILHWGEFIFSAGALQTFKLFSQVFGRIFIVTNQRGVSKGLMSEAGLHAIHAEMMKEVESAGGHIDKIYYCTDKDDTCFNRKPNPGMALEAVADFPDIDLNKAIMVGNKPSDMRFGRAAGMHTVFVRTTNPHQVFPHADIDLVYDTLEGFAKALID